jgi:two-component system, NtrC family, response regulator HydG
MTAGAGHTLACERIDLEDAFPELDGSSPAMRRLKRHMLRVAEDGDVTVLVLGESGTGKERVARAIHDRSPRRHAPFVVVNCAGLSPSLAEDELFGHVRGAFTGAVHDRAGPFERASGGTVFLDEIGDLAPELQLRLLRVLQARTVQRLGGQRDTTVDVRVIAATNVDLARARARGRFRDDLYYRLKVYDLHVPPLRCRGSEDISTLAIAIVRRLSERRRRRAWTIDAAVVNLFTRYRWPGNVRELENTLERMVVAAGPAAVLAIEDLPEDFVEAVRSFPRGVTAVFDPASRGGPSDDEVVAAMGASGFSRQRAAAVLGLSRHQLYRIVRQRASLAARLAPGRAR